MFIFQQRMICFPRLIRRCSPVFSQGRPKLKDVTRLVHNRSSRRFGLSSQPVAMFSSRTPELLERNRLSQAARRVRASGASLVDLTESNPTRVGLRYPRGLLQCLADPAGLRYDPAPLGLRTARRAVADHLARFELAVDPTRIVMTNSTSDAYSMLFKLLCDPGDGVHVPRPGYPLLEHLARLEGVVSVPYLLDYHGRWEIDVTAIRDHDVPPARAVVLVNPNNPTGSFVETADLDAVTALCRERELALIADEVFRPYPMADDRIAPSVLDRPAEVLTFVLGGLSKDVGLPQLKLGWMVVTGPDALVDDALARLELIYDTYLSVGTPVQHHVAELLDAGSSITRQIAQRVRDNYACLERLVSSFQAITMRPAEGGWYAVLQVPRTRSEEALVLEILERNHVLVQPGYFFDFPREAFLVASLLPDPSEFALAMRRVLRTTTR